MPLYEYQCQQCSERVEVIQKHSDPPYSHCPKCGGDMKKLLSAPAIQFKGSGFYKTDYASGSKGGSSTTKSESSSSSDGGGESKSEKSETKTTETKSSETKAAD